MSQEYMSIDEIKEEVLRRTNGVPNDDVLLSATREFSQGIMAAAMQDKINLSFSGCGFMCIYHAGVCAAIKEYAPRLALNKVSGASAGSIAAAGLVCNVCISQATSAILTVVTKARERALGALHPSFNLIGLVRENLQRILPEDAHIRCTGRLEVSLTKVGTNENVIVDTFETKQELIDAIVCSCFIPFYCGRTPAGRTTSRLPTGTRLPYHHSAENQTSVPAMATALVSSTANSLTRPSDTLLGICSD
ncbi:hypothetical protein L596_003989 [Steinernema carpocapsae]|uniref:PNPLA domain-containing protein n=1 Tax=Steinernema carpocapsae TaxID=34508 RepID=A0A4U8UXR3_STECR|nr:hypothetical protein L596_003989 [Steinernema carpocapsae]